MRSQLFEYVQGSDLLMQAGSFKQSQKLINYSTYVRLSETYFKRYTVLRSNVSVSNVSNPKRMYSVKPYAEVHCRETVVSNDMQKSTAGRL